MVFGINLVLFYGDAGGMAINRIEMTHDLARGLDLRDPLSIITVLAEA